MHGMMNGLALAVALGIGDYWLSPMLSEIYRVPAGIWADTTDPDVPKSWLSRDPADSIYRLARETLNRRDYRRAAELFAQIPARFPRSGYAGDALYWQAFALYRTGGERELREALAALRQQKSRFPKAATQGDGSTLERRIQGELARRGDSQAAAEVVNAARDAGDVPPVPPVPRVPPVPPVPLCLPYRRSHPESPVPHFLAPHLLARRGPGTDA